ncbi:MAG: TonB-dependent receptor [Lewinellaceae bacterium]|nr:TonB-dependent receptor [Lewinellaceae bacterium]
MKNIITLAAIVTMLPALVFAQRTVSGVVNSTEGPLIGVNIQVKGTTLGAISGIDGDYTLEVANANDTLVFSYVGYVTKEEPLAGRTTVNVDLELESELLNEVVVVGYGVTRKSDLTGSVARVESGDIAKIPTASLSQALQGKVSGVQVTPASGEPGADAIIRVRGVGSFRGADPLFVVDGMIVNDITFVNPQDVENVSVLKDASATAIYGARGANGVIIVTTKRGSFDQDAQVSVSAYRGYQNVIKKIDLTNGVEYATLANELSVNEGRKAPFEDPSIFGEGTDWQDVIFQTAPTQNYQLSFSGGSQKMAYNISANYYQQDGIIRGSDFQRFTLRLNNDYQLKPYLKIGHNLAIVYTNQKIGAGVLNSALRADPLTPVRDSLGNFGDASIYSSSANVEASIFYNDNYQNGYRAIGNTYMDVKFLNGFTFRSNIGLDFLYSDGKSFVPIYYVSAIQQNTQNVLNVRSTRSRNWLWENTLAYAGEWGAHRLNAVAGITVQDNFAEFLGGSRRNYVDESQELRYLSAGEQGTESNYNNVGGDWAMISYLFRANYTLMDRYLFTFSSRVDGSTRFGKNNRYGFFPSVALGWNITNEPFISDIPFLSRLKLRASWGRTGNDRIGDYEYTSLVTLNQGAVFGPNETLNNGATITKLSNPDLRWEETTQADVGLEIGLFDNKFQAEVDYFHRVSDGVLYETPIPAYLGANAPAQNTAKIQNTGFDFDLKWQQRLTNKLSYNLGAVISLLDNEVLRVDGQGSDLFGGGGLPGGQLATNSRAGWPVGAFYGYQLDGVFQNEGELSQYPKLGTQVVGDLRFHDTNGDGVITPDDRTLIGNPTPDVIYSFSAGLEFAGIDLSVEFNGQAGNELVNAKRMGRFGLYNFESVYLDRWHGEGTSNTEPRVTTSGINYEFSERFLEDGDFLRLRTIQIGYTLPQSVLRKVNFSNLRVYVSATNPYTWQRFSGFTPELYNANVFDVGIDTGTYPIAKTFLAGINLSF